MNKNKQHVILGSGPLGQSIARALINQGACARLVNRSGRCPDNLAGVEIEAADLYDQAEVQRVTAGTAVVYQCAQPGYAQWVSMFPSLIDSILQGMEGSGARLVMGDNLYMYGEVDGPLTEDLPHAARSRKGITRARIAEKLMEAHAKGKVPVTIGRGADFFGPAALESTLGEQVFGALLRGKPAGLLGNPDLPHTFTYIDDFGRALVTLGTRDEALGQVWHVPGTETQTTRQVVNCIAEEIGVQPKMQVAGPFLLRAIGLFNPKMRELVEMEYQFSKPFVVDDSKYQQAFNQPATPMRKAIQETVAWYRAYLQKTR
jgi:nucleoside-diphosphate-sugar epimerase